MKLRGLEPVFFSKTLYGQLTALIGGLQPVSRDTDINAEMYNCWWTNKRS